MWNKIIAGTSKKFAEEVSKGISSNKKSSKIPNLNKNDADLKERAININQLKEKMLKGKSIMESSFTNIYLLSGINEIEYEHEYDDVVLYQIEDEIDDIWNGIEDIDKLRNEVKKIILASEYYEKKDGDYTLKYTGRKVLASLNKINYHLTTIVDLTELLLDPNSDSIDYQIKSNSIMKKAEAYLKKLDKLEEELSELNIGKHLENGVITIFNYSD